MPRTKQYCENEVAEKAMELFWDKGYLGTSTKMLEEATGINKFSMYSSFGSKKGLFLAGIKRYVEKTKLITEKLRNSNNGITGIKEYFLDFLSFSKQQDCRHGCFIANTTNEIIKTPDPEIIAEIRKYNDRLKGLFVNNLKQEAHLTAKEIDQKADALIIALIGFTTASKYVTEEQLNHFIEETF